MHGSFFRSKDGLFTLLILLFAAALRLFDISDESLWLDEGYSWWDAQQGLTALWTLVPQCDPHPPLYPLLLKLWIAVGGDSVVALRGLSTVFSLLAVFFVIRAGSRISAQTGWIAGLLFAAAPFQIEFAQEARPYTLVVLGAALILYGFLRLAHPAHNERSGSGLAAVFIGGAISLWSNNTAIFTVTGAGLVAIGLLWVDSRSRHLTRGFFLIAISLLLCWLPYVPVYLQQAQGISSDFWIPYPSPWRVFNELRFVFGFASFQVLWFLFPLWMLGLYCLWSAGKRRAAWILFGLFLLPALLNLSVSLLVKPIFLARALIGMAPAFYIAVAAAIAALVRPGVRHAALAVYVGTCVFMTAQLIYAPVRKEPWDQIASALIQQGGGNTLVLAVPNEMALPLRHVLMRKSKTLEIRGVPADFPAPGLPARYPSGKCAPSVVGQDLSAVVAQTQGRQTVLFLTRAGNVYDPQDQIRPLLEAGGFKLARTLRFMPGFVEVHVFQAPEVMHAAK